jgi:hypothetical protein
MGSRMYDELNRTELQELCREVDGKNVHRDGPRSELEATLDGEEGEECPLSAHRQEMQDHIRRNFRRLRTQLPGCNGKCVSYGCPNMIVVRCWMGLKEDIL